MSINRTSLSEQLKKNPDIKPIDIEILRKWVSTQPHLPAKYITDLDLLLVYHCSDRSHQVAKQLLDLNLTLRTMFPFFQKREFDKNLQLSFQTCLLTPLLGLSVKGNPIFYFQYLDSDPKNFVCKDAVKHFLMVIDLWQLVEGTFPGLAILLDLGNFNFGHIARIDLTVIQQIFYYVQEAIFLQYREFHIINAPTFMDSLLSMFRPFIKKQLYEMIKIHQRGSNTLYKYIDQDILPKELGGKNKGIFELRDEQLRIVKNNQEYLLEESKKRVDESKRPGNPKTLSTLFTGMEGSFKTLDID